MTCMSLRLAQLLNETTLFMATSFTKHYTKFVAKKKQIEAHVWKGHENWHVSVELAKLIQNIAILKAHNKYWVTT